VKNAAGAVGAGDEQATQAIRARAGKHRMRWGRVDDRDGVTAWASSPCRWASSWSSAAGCPGGGIIDDDTPTLVVAAPLQEVEIVTDDMFTLRGTWRIVTTRKTTTAGASRVSL
jgi:hypothetical protein